MGLSIPMKKRIKRQRRLRQIGARRWRIGVGVLLILIVLPVIAHSPAIGFAQAAPARRAGKPADVSAEDNVKTFELCEASYTAAGSRRAFHITGS